MITTERLYLQPSDPALADAVAAFYQRNRTAHERWSPPAMDALFTVPGQHERLTKAAAEAAAQTALRWWLIEREDAAQRVIGTVGLTQIARGPFCSAQLGYAVDTQREGRGLMREALQAVLAHAFGPLGLHRVQANARPDNARSLALLDRLGFEREGLAREYLFIDGAWRDHLLTALRHPDWPRDRPPG
jgi:[ribosomal protein S5]-alanine N-acetyltransferase